MIIQLERVETEHLASDVLKWRLTNGIPNL